MFSNKINNNNNINQISIGLEKLIKNNNNDTIDLNNKLSKSQINYSKPGELLEFSKNSYDNNGNNYDLKYKPGMVLNIKG